MSSFHLQGFLWRPDFPGLFPRLLDIGLMHLRLEPSEHWVYHAALEEVAAQDNSLRPVSRKLDILFVECSPF